MLNRGVHNQDAILKNAGSTFPACVDRSVVESSNKRRQQQNRSEQPGISHGAQPIMRTSVDQFGSCFAVEGLRTG
jgi:hypothetical protein